MKKIFLTSFLLVSLFICPNASFSNRVGESEGRPSSVRSAATLTRSYALTSFHSQLTAGDSSKENRVRHPIITFWLVPRKLIVPNAASGLRLIIDDGHLLYLSARFSRPIGRGPPPSA
jgi:hypothetical protein